MEQSKIIDTLETYQFSPDFLAIFLRDWIQVKIELQNAFLLEVETEEVELI